MFKLEFETDNAAFGDTYQSVEALSQIRRALLGVIDKVFSETMVNGTIRDINGNTIGKWEYRP